MPIETGRGDSIAVPPLGCGLGGLAWSMVRPLIIAAFEGLPELRVVLFEPEGAPPKAPGRRRRGR
ncbi:MAG TPA: hypothetical protein VFS43_14035 [Polyangiaceae bacterium]|nr:hypothetical protein [Polyangiaceae bacterium]